MFSWNDIKQITQYIHQQTRIPSEAQRLFFRGVEITAYNQRKQQQKNKIKNANKPKKKNKKLSSRAPTIGRFGITHESTIYLQCDKANEDFPIVQYGRSTALLPSSKSNEQCSKLISDCTEGLYDDMCPKLSEDGEGGTYFMRNGHNEKIACFKPSDEEAGCLNNPRGRVHDTQSMHDGIKPGEGHLREVAAFLLDSTGFHNVPPTIRVEVCHSGFNENNTNNSNASSMNNSLSSSPHNNTKSIIPPAPSVDELLNGFPEPVCKVGSLQAFIKGEVIENFAARNFAIREVHKIGILDIRLLNCDRNSGNVLVRRDEYNRFELIPIDHGLSMPSKIEITRDSWVWLNWEQSKQPFDPFTVKFINNIDVDRDIELLRSELNIADMALENMKISNLVLKKGCKNGLTLHEIGSIISRPDFDKVSMLESLMTQAEILANEKFRQNKHFLTRTFNRRRATANTVFTPKHMQTQGNKRNTIATDDCPPIVRKFMEKGLPLKVPVLGIQSKSNCGVDISDPNSQINETSKKSEASMTFPSMHPHLLQSYSEHSKKSTQSQSNGSNAVPSPFLMPYVESLAPPGHRTVSNHKNGNNNSKFQVLNKNPKGNASRNTPSPSPPMIMHGSPLHISSIPRELSSSTSLGAAKAPFFALISAQKRPNTIIIRKSPRHIERAESGSNTDDGGLKPQRSSSSGIAPFWTPNLQPSNRGMRFQKSNPSLIRSVTPDRTKHMKKEETDAAIAQMNLENAQQLSSEMTNLFLETPPELYSVQKFPETNDINAIDNDELVIVACKTTDQLNAAMSPIFNMTTDNGSSLHQLHSPLRIENYEEMPVMEKTASFTDRDGTLLNQGNQGKMGSIFESISVETDTTTSADDDAHDVDPSKFDCISIKPELTQIDTLTYSDDDDGGDGKNENSDNKGNIADIRNGAKSVTNRTSTTSTEIQPFSRSQSLVTFKKRTGSFKSLHDSCEYSLLTNVTPVSNKSSYKHNGGGQSKDEDSILNSVSSSTSFAFNKDLSSQSLIAHPSMLKMRDSGGGGSVCGAGSGNGVEMDLELAVAGGTSSAASLKCGNLVSLNVVPGNVVSVDDTVVTTKRRSSGDLTSPSNSKSSLCGDLPVMCDRNNTVSEFGIHPIMERMAKETAEVRQYFMYYLDQLLNIQCERISKRARKNDDLDDIYDVDTVKGAFIWKNELRKHWIRSRIERKRLAKIENQIKVTNPFAKMGKNDEQKNNGNVGSDVGAGNGGGANGGNDNDVHLKRNDEAESRQNSGNSGTGESAETMGEYGFFSIDCYADYHEPSEDDDD